MYTICETTVFTKYYSDYWSEEEYSDFQMFLASNPNAGVVEPNTGGVRKIRWRSGKTGKRSGVRVIYFNRLANGEIWLLTIYEKSTTAKLSKKTLKALAEKLNESF